MPAQSNARAWAMLCVVVDDGRGGRRVRSRRSRVGGATEQDIQTSAMETTSHFVNACFFITSYTRLTMFKSTSAVSS